MFGLLWSALLRVVAFLPLQLVRVLRSLQLRRRGLIHVRLGAATSGRAEGLLASRRRVDALLQVARDPAVRGVLLDVRGVSGGWAELQELRSALVSIRDAGKVVMTHLHALGLRDLYLASVADRVWMTPSGVAILSPIGARLQFFGDALESAGVKVDVVSAGDYKSLGERFTRSHPSRENREALRSVLADLEAQLVAEIAASRSVAADTVRAVLGAGPVSVDDLVRDGLVDAAQYPDQSEDVIDELMGARHRRLGLRSYGKLARAEAWLQRCGQERDVVAVVHLEGPIVEGGDPDGESGRRVEAERVVPVLDRLRKHDAVSSVVLYVDSPGGSALASDLIARSVGRLANQKPVVACFHNVSASGGYYLAAPCSEIVARGTSITGSIGVVGGKVVLGPALARLGIHGETVGATKEPGFLAPWREFTAAERQTYREMLHQTYQRFLAVVSSGRRRPVDAVHEVAQGRIWTGRQGHANGLVDHVGGLSLAVERAQRLARGELGPVELVHVKFRASRLAAMRGLVRRRMGAASLRSWFWNQLGSDGALVRFVDQHAGGALALMPWSVDPDEDSRYWSP